MLRRLQQIMKLTVKVTVISAPQSGKSAEGANRMVGVPQAQAIGGQTSRSGECRELPQQGPGSAPAVSDFFVYTDKI